MMARIRSHVGRWQFLFLGLVGFPLVSFVMMVRVRGGGDCCCAAAMSLLACHSF